ncbi:hypothetical protein LTR28_008437, partial [Elasticomyces elasticus]
MTQSAQEIGLRRRLRDLPHDWNNRFTDESDRALRELLFRSLSRNEDHYLRLLFPEGPPTDATWDLSQAQGASDGAEYTAAARGHACGHIFKQGESTYQCRTCSADDTCVLCTRCFNASDHDGHLVFISISPGNSGCCDCGDDEAWLREVRCSIHSANADHIGKKAGKSPALPDELVGAIKMTIARSLDFLCDVFSCSPEQLRHAKSKDSVQEDERCSRLLPKVYGHESRYNAPDVDPEFALVLWNDEKHTVDDVRDQVARACKQSKKFGLSKAMEVNDCGRSVILYNHDVGTLLDMAAVLEQLKVTVTIRSARDTFREQMCATIIEWISEISGCSVGSDPYILRNTICEEMLSAWNIGSQARNIGIGQDGIDDHQIEDEELARQYRRLIHARARVPVVRMNIGVVNDNNTTNTTNNDDEDNDENAEEDEDMDGSEAVADEEMIDLDPVDISNILAGE